MDVNTVDKKTERIFGLSDIAAAEGIGKHAAQKRFERGKYPAPDYILPGGSKGWKRSTLEKAGILTRGQK